MKINHLNKLAKFWNILVPQPTWISISQIYKYIKLFSYLYFLFLITHRQNKITIRLINQNNLNFNIQLKSRVF